MKELKMNLQLFSADVNPINVTTQSSMSPTMKTFYDTTLLENARESMIFTQFGKKQPMKGGKVEWRKFNTFGKALTPLTEGVIPTGQTFGMTNIEGTITQHGDFTAVSDRLELESFDDVIFGATEEMGATEGETYDTLTRNILVAGNSVAYCPDKSGNVPENRAAITKDCILTPEMVSKAATWLKKNKAPKINGSYVGIIHPNCKFDLMNDPEWRKPHEYVDTENIYKNEIGEIGGVRFVQSTRAKVFKGAGANGADVYSTLIIADDAYGVTEITGGGLEHIIKQKGSAGTADPINQRATCGWKATKVAELLVPQYIVRVETTATP